AVEVADRDCADGDAIETAHVHVDLIRIGTRNIKWMNAARRAKRVLGDAGIEAICRQRILAALKVGGLPRHDEMKKALFAADPAIAFGDSRQIRGHAKAHPPTMAAALISLQYELSGVMAGHSRSKDGVVELVIGPDISGRTRWLALALPSKSKSFERELKTW